MLLVGALQDALDVLLGHRLADLPVHDGTARAVEDRAQVVEGAREVEVGDVDVPMLVGPQRLHEPSALLGRLLVPAVEQARGGEHAVDARRAGRDDLLVDHHERQPAVALEREALVEGDDLALLLVEQPVVTRHMAVVLVRLAVAPLPGEELAARDADPRDEPIGGDLGLVGPHAHEIDNRVAEVVGNPATAQGTPSSFFTATSSAATSAITWSFLASLASSSLVLVTLLRVLQEGEVRPLGANTAVKVDIRVVAATHQDILARRVAGRFRQDLYARLAGFEMVLPALRDRPEDLGTLIAALLPRVAPEPERITLDRFAARALFRYDWPLNIRELEQALRAAVALTDTGEIQLEHLSEAIRTYAPPSPEAAMAAMEPEDRTLRELLIKHLHEHAGNVGAVGRAMGKAPTQIRRWCDRLQIELSQFRRLRRPRGKR